MFLRTVFSVIKLQIQIMKEFLSMTFTTNSKIAQSYAILILAEQITIDNVPNVYNLRATVNEILGAESAA